MDQERDEAALAALREHEKACAERALIYEKRLTALEVSVANNTKLLWAIFGVVVAVAIKDIVTPLFSG